MREKAAAALEAAKNYEYKKNAAATYDAAKEVVGNYEFRQKADETVDTIRNHDYKQTANNAATAAGNALEAAKAVEYRKNYNAAKE